MKTAESTPTLSKPIHPWLQKISLAYLPGPTTPLLDNLASDILETFDQLGHEIQATPDDDTHMLLTTARYGEVVSWRKSLLFTGRIRLKLAHQPTVYTLIQMTPAEYEEKIAYFSGVLANDPPNPDDFQFPGLTAVSHRVLIEQGLRGGPILSLIRLLQAQSKSIRILLVIGEEHVERVYHIDLVGSYPHTDADDLQAFYEDIVLRIVTSESTGEIIAHEVLEPIVERSEWEALTTPEAMRVAGCEIGGRNFFTEMLRVADLVHVPAVDKAVSSQYSEGCFATWDPTLEALIATVTGSSRPVDKENITEDELAVIVGVRQDGKGARVRHVVGNRNDPPSSESVEMMAMDFALPQITLASSWDISQSVPVIRSKLHGHRGVRAYDPALVEFLLLDSPYYHYLVSCATEAQAVGIEAAFSRAECFLNPDDPRQVAFTVLPGHGVVVAEKWVEGKQPLQTLWEFMDNGTIQIEKHIPQGPMAYAPEDGMMVLVE